MKYETLTTKKEFAYFSDELTANVPHIGPLNYHKCILHNFIEYEILKQQVFYASICLIIHVQSILAKVMIRTHYGLPMLIPLLLLLPPTPPPSHNPHSSLL